jgi:hypothetical protein
MISALILGFDDQRPALARNFSTKACARDSAADDHDFEIRHLSPGYELERRAV